MQPSDNYMDELFRKAGENYPLKTDSGDWDALLERIPDDASIMPASKASAKKDYRKLLLLLLLLPFAVVGYNYFYKNGNGEKNISTQKINIAQQNNNAVEINKSAAGKNDPIASSSSKPLQQSVSEDGNKIKNQFVNDDDDKQTIKNSNSPDPPIQFSELNKNTNSLLQNKKNDERNNFTLNDFSSKNNTNNSTEKNDNNLNKNIIEDKRNPGESYTGIALSKGDSSGKKPAMQKIKQHYFYAGILGGIDASTVKFQSIKKAGYSLGVLAGYKFSSHLSAEAGFNWDKKQYYSDGKYFNSIKAGFPQGDKILNMDGNCSMFEIPLALKYDFAQHEKNNFFATAGLSSYIMKKEAYNYTASYYGDIYNANKSYNNSSRNWFSVAQLSVGYEKQLNKKYTFRIEPYAKIPLKGLGIGSMSIASGGLYIGVTRSIH